jgi:hypothetical protein
MLSRHPECMEKGHGMVRYSSLDIAVYGDGHTWEMFGRIEGIIKDQEIIITIIILSSVEMKRKVFKAG